MSPITEDTAYSEHKTQMIPTGSELKASFLLTLFRVSKKYDARHKRRERVIYSSCPQPAWQGILKDMVRGTHVDSNQELYNWT